MMEYALRYAIECEILKVKPSALREIKESDYLLGYWAQVCGVNEPDIRHQGVEFYKGWQTAAVLDKVGGPQSLMPNGGDE